MAECVTQTSLITEADGSHTYQFTNLNVPDLMNCEGYQVVLDNSEYSALLNNSSETFLTNLFNPAFITTEQYQMLFMLGLTTPLFGYIVAWGYQTVISFMTKN